MTTPGRVSDALARAIQAQNASRDAARTASEEIAKSRETATTEEGMESEEQ